MLVAAPLAEAKRMGGGSSLGRQSSNVTQRQATPPAAPARQQTAQQQPGQTNAAPAKKPSGVGAMLGGLAAGLGLAWLASSLGLGEGFANILMIGLLVMAGLAIFRMVKRRSQAASASGAGAAPFAFQGNAPVPAAAGDVFNPPQYKPEKVGNDASARPWEQFGQAAPVAGAAAGGGMIGAALSGAQTWGIPADFDTEGFITAAKRNYLSLQAAWDAGDLATLRSMMTDEMLSEVRQQLAEREAEAEGAANINEIEGLEAQLLGIEDQGDVYLASVEFSGMSREEQGAGLSPFREVWNMAKPKSGNGGWLVAGLQALT
jgi:predicted lipid-binding transport protein (Tim44 family)